MAPRDIAERKKIERDLQQFIHVMSDINSSSNNNVASNVLKICRSKATTKRHSKYKDLDREEKRSVVKRRRMNFLTPRREGDNGTIEDPELSSQIPRPGEHRHQETLNSIESSGGSYIENAGTERTGMSDKLRATGLGAPRARRYD